MHVVGGAAATPSDAASPSLFTPRLVAPFSPPAGRASPICPCPRPRRHPPPPARPVQPRSRATFRLALAPLPPAPCPPCPPRLRERVGTAGSSCGGKRPRPLHPPPPVPPPRGSRGSGRAHERRDAAPFGSRCTRNASTQSIPNKREKETNRPPTAQRATRGHEKLRTVHHPALFPSGAPFQAPWAPSATSAGDPADGRRSRSRMRTSLSLSFWMIKMYSQPSFSFAPCCAKYSKL